MGVCHCIDWQIISPQRHKAHKVHSGWSNVTSDDAHGRAAWSDCHNNFVALNGCASFLRFSILALCELCVFMVRYATLATALATPDQVRGDTTLKC
jgi:hypothetical protein